MAITERWVTRGDVATRVLGVDGDGPVALLLHGFTDSADTWRRVLPLLHARGWAARAVDLPGFGVAGRPDPDGFPSYDRFVAACVRHLHEQTGRPVLIAGNSLGGTFAMRAAQDTSLPLQGVVPIAPAGPALAGWLRAAARIGAVGNGAVPSRLPGRPTRRALGLVYGRVAFGGRASIDRDAVRHYLGHNGDSTAVIARLHIAMSLYPEILAPWNPAAIEVPVHVLWGSRDRLVDVAGAVPLANAVADGRVTVLPGIGHLPQLEAPDAVVEALENLAAGGEAPASRSVAAS